jgi:hypothetical protein
MRHLRGSAAIARFVQKEVTEVVRDQGGQAEKLQEKVQEIVMAKVAEAVRKEAEKGQQETEGGTKEKKTVL